MHLLTGLRKPEIWKEQDENISVKGFARDRGVIFMKGLGLVGVECASAVMHS